MSNQPPRPATQRLRIPGPTAVPERVRQAIAEQVVNHRGPEFRAILHETFALLKPLFGTTGDILPFAASGTGGMEAAIANIVTQGDRVLVVINGQFGDRFKAIAEAFGAIVDTAVFELGTAPDSAIIAERLAKADYRAVFVTHNESSTGAVADLAAIGAVVREHDALLVVDSVSGLGAMAVNQDQWHLDIVVTASQKALMCPPGIALVSVSAKAWNVVNRVKAARFFWDFRKAKAAADQDEAAFTPAVSLIAGLRVALDMIHAEGLANVFERHRRLATALRAGAEALGMPVFTSAPILSNSVMVLRLPDTLESGRLVNHMYQHYNTVITGARAPALNGKVIRIGTMGSIDAADILTDLHYLERSLADLGRPAQPGAGVAAAAAVLAS